MKTKNKTTAYIVYSIAAAMLVLTAQISFAGNATWLSSPQDSAWENANNWTIGGPPNGPSDIATFAQSSQRYPDISTSVEVNSIVFTSGSSSFGLSILGGELTVSGTGVHNNNSVSQSFFVGGRYLGTQGHLIFNNTSATANGQIGIGNSDAYPDSDGLGYTIFNGTSSAGHASITNYGPCCSHASGGHTSFTGTSTAADASIYNGASPGYAGGGWTGFGDTSTAGRATITNESDFVGGYTIFGGSSTADSAILVANAGGFEGGGGAIIFNGASAGGTARVEVFDFGYMDISGHQSGVTIGSIEGSGNVFLGANDLTVGTRNINTSFSGVISGTGSLAKVGSGVLTLQANDCIADTAGLMLVSGSIIKLDFTGPPEVIASLKVNGVPQPPGIYGGPTSGAPHILPEFAGSGTVSVGPLSILGNISTRAFVETGDDVMIGGFIVRGTEPKRVIIRALGPKLTEYGVPNVLVNPTLELHDRTGALIASNDNWMTTIIGGIITSDQVADIRNSSYAPTDQRESAIVADLPAGNYTAIVRGVSNTTGVALAEVYDLNPQPSSFLRNISTRSFVQTGDNVMIGGFIVERTQPRGQRVIIRALGPELTQYGVPNALADPALELYDANGYLIASNDNWQHTIIGGIITRPQVQDIRNSGYAPANPSESVIIARLPAGNYTAIVRGVNNTTGVALVEVYR
jgi:hypothetical protein